MKYIGGIALIGWGVVTMYATVVNDPDLAMRALCAAIGFVFTGWGFLLLIGKGW